MMAANICDKHRLKPHGFNPNPKAALISSGECLALFGFFKAGDYSPMSGYSKSCNLMDIRCTTGVL